MKFGDVDSGHLDSVPAEGHVGVQERQREPLQIEPVESFGIAGIQAMPLDAMLSESATHSAQLAGAKTGDWNTPIALWVPQRT